MNNGWWKGAKERGQLNGIDWFFPLYLREAKLQEFINLKQGHMSVREYSLMFTKLSKYAPIMVADPIEWMSKFIFGVSELLSKECKMTMFMKEMDISWLMTYIEQN